MKRIFTLFLIAVLCLMLASCSLLQKPEKFETPDVPAPADQPQEEEPEEPEEPKVFVVASDAELFVEGAETVLGSCPLEVVTCGLAEIPAENIGAMAVCLTEENADTAALKAAVESGASVAVFDTTGTNKVDGAMYFDYDASAMTEQVMAETLAFPPHDTPVRLIGMFTSQDSEAYAVWTKNYEEGKIFPKEIYIAADSDQDAKAWISEKLEHNFPGMLDAIFVETEEMALAVGEVMISLGRDDAEVFSCEASDKVAELMQKSPRLFAEVIGVNTCYAGAYAASAALKAMDGTETADMTFGPCTLFAAELKDGIDGFFSDAMKEQYPY